MYLSVQVYFFAFYHLGFSQVYLASNQPGHGQLLNSVPILTSVGQGQSNGGMNQRIVAVGGNHQSKSYPVKIEPVDGGTEQGADSNASRSTSASELGTDVSEENGHEAPETRSEQLVIKQEQNTGNEASCLTS